MRDDLVEVDQEDHAVDADGFPLAEGVDHGVGVADRGALLERAEHIAGTIAQLDRAGLGAVGGRGVDVAHADEVGGGVHEGGGAGTAEPHGFFVGLAAVHPADAVDAVVDEFADGVGVLDHTAVVGDALFVLVGGADRDAEQAHAALGGLDRGFRAGDGDPHRRVGLLDGLGQHGALGHREVLALPAGDFVGPHVGDGADHLVPHVLGVVGLNLEAAEFGPGGGAAGAEFEASVGDDVERGGALGDAGGVVDLGQAEGDALADVDVLGLRGGGGEENFGGGGVAVLLEEVVLDLPDLVEAELVGEADVFERLVVGAPLGDVAPGALDGVLVEDAEFHGRPRRRRPSGWSGGRAGLIVSRP